MGRLLHQPPFRAGKCNFLLSAKHVPRNEAILTPALSKSNASSHFSEPLGGYLRFGDKGAGAAYLLTPDGRESARNNSVLFVDISDGQVRLWAVAGSVCFVCRTNSELLLFRPTSPQVDGIICPWFSGCTCFHVAESDDSLENPLGFLIMYLLVPLIEDAKRVRPELQVIVNCLLGSSRCVDSLATSHILYRPAFCF